jgi:alanine racemase
VAPIAAERAEWLGVNDIEEAGVLTRLGITKPIVILGFSAPQTAKSIVAANYRQAIYRIDAARALSEAAGALSAAARIHLKIETGTNRQGVRPEDLGDFVRELQKLPGLEVEGVYTHFANVEDTIDPSFARRQLKSFRDAIDILAGLGIHPPQIHAAATAGALLYPDAAFTMIRTGIGIYGIWPSRETQLAARERGRAISLTPALTWKTRIVQVKNVPAGEYVGYGLTFQAGHDMRLAVLPIGYYDGYDRKLSNSGRVLVGGHHAPVIGRIAMNMTMVDVTDIPAHDDDEVVLIGRQGERKVSAEELAEKSGTIAYEFLARINPLLPRIVV